MPIPNICVVILKVSKEERIFIGDATSGEALLLESGCVAKEDSEEANRRGNQVLKVSSIGMGSWGWNQKMEKTCSIKSTWQDI